MQRLIELQRTKKIGNIFYKKVTEREAIDNLKRELRMLREQSSSKETKMREALERRKKVIEELRADNEELRDQVEHYEKERMQTKNKNKRRTKEEPEEEEVEEHVMGRKAGNLNKMSHKQDKNEEEEEDQSAEANSEEESETETHSLKVEVEKLRKHKGKQKKKEMKAFLKDFYASFSNPIPNRENEKLQINNDNYKYDENTHFKKYKWGIENECEVVKEEENEGKTYKTFSDGRKQIQFGNGAVKEIMPDGYTIGTYILKKGIDY